MSHAIESIVNGYVRLNNSQALENLLAHRQNLLDGLERLSGIKPTLVLAQVREEIAIVETGLERLGGQPAAAGNQARVLQLTVSELPSNNGSSAAPVAASDTATVPDQSAQAPTRDAELAPSETKQQATEIKVLGLVISTVSTVDPSPTIPALNALDSGSFALCPPQSNDPTQGTDKESENIERPYSRIDALKSLVSSVWSDDSMKR